MIISDEPELDLSEKRAAFRLIPTKQQRLILGPQLLFNSVCYGLKCSMNEPSVWTQATTLFSRWIIISDTKVQCVPSNVKLNCWLTRYFRFVSTMNILSSSSPIYLKATTTFPFLIHDSMRPPVFSFFAPQIADFSKTSKTFGALFASLSWTSQTITSSI